LPVLVKRISQSLDLFRICGKFKEAKNARGAGEFRFRNKPTFNQKNSKVPSKASVLLVEEKHQRGDAKNIWGWREQSLRGKKAQERNGSLRLLSGNPSECGYSTGAKL
jgi:hypothetical protein